MLLPSRVDLVSLIPVTKLSAIFLLVFSAFFAIEAKSWAGSCQQNQWRISRMLITQQPSCSIYSSRMLLVERNFWFGNDGLFFVFVSTTESPSDRESTGARLYYLFPRKAQTPIVDEKANGNVHIQSAYGVEAEIDPNTGKMVRLAGTQFIESDDITTKNNGGFEITKTSGVVVDMGWMKGELPSSKPLRDAKIFDAKGSSCVVQNQELLNYVNGQPSFKFATDNEFRKFLQKDARCKSLKF